MEVQRPERPQCLGSVRWVIAALIAAGKNAVKTDRSRILERVRERERVVAIDSDEEQ